MKILQSCQLLEEDPESELNIPWNIRRRSSQDSEVCVVCLPQSIQLQSGQGSDIESIRICCREALRN